jgi:Chs5-Arf1p-binding protein BUD7/BCH1
MLQKGGPHHDTGKRVEVFEGRRRTVLSRYPPLSKHEKISHQGLGWQVGSDPEVQVATVVSNHLTSAIMKYFGNSCRYQHAANLFEKLLPREPEVASLLAKSYIGMCESIGPLVHIATDPECFEDEEVKAVQVMNNAMNESNHSYTLLHVQCEFLRSKGRHEWALKLARQAVNSAPSEFVTWEMLTQVYIDLGEYESVGGFPRPTRVSNKAKIQ